MFRRRRIVVATVMGTVVLLVAALTAFVWPGYGVPEPEPTPTVTTTAPPPTPTIEPAPREGEQTDLTGALPDTVLAFVQRGLVDNAPWHDDHGAVESWRVTYTDGEGGDATEVVLTVGQWSEESDATSFYDAQAKAAGRPLKGGTVQVDGEDVGSYSVTAEDDGEGVIWWRNGTVVIQVVGPAEVVEDFYSAYPL
ncbi:hypothetical protein DNL40_11220 [Xylanimonas oleitrophica]|uniref:DUF4245 domain-containing protein n=1 Tax=Xylanimonas oleitrophica TaxID=2607479 RepID=A0A2W5WMA0_9MICO|nr:hypothetical protein DNL40_11220 [Xylanimonas oleitrophica]